MPSPETKLSLAEDSHFMARPAFERSTELVSHRPPLAKQKLIPTGRFDIYSPEKRLAGSTLANGLQKEMIRSDCFKTPIQDRHQSIQDFSTSEVLAM